MEAESFKIALSEAKPGINMLLGVGLNRDEAMSILSSFEIGERTVADRLELSDSALNDLFSRYNVSQVEIGMVRLRDRPETVSEGWIIGEVEADYLMLDATSAEVVVKDVTLPTHMIWRCAKDGSSFLDALAEAANYLGKCLSIDLSGTSAQYSTLDCCVFLAGGEAYAPFFRMLLGVE